MKKKEDNTSSGLHNTLASGTIVKGDIFTETDFRLDGKVDGNVTCNGKIVIGPKGRVLGNLTSGNAEILGEVEGTILIGGKLVIKSNAIIKGDIQAQTVEIEPNAHFNGSCSMCGENNNTAT